ncbi:hypothetical protein ABEX32_12880 [Brevibacillus fortis]|uniref:Methyltransferase type 11 domain-containing protein n=1 Tax=Brevibacillus fortis TaxID=2126352 RepID=A0A2P7VCD5_9BACL|nr:hypothetical protein [Brevibacillus fortis]PSJ96873.1 hypothetical protein C7R93_09840 [Brevibacillus fortis]
MEDTYKGQVDNPLSLNRYTYTHNNPLRFVDPSGHAPEQGLGVAPSNGNWKDSRDLTPSEAMWVLSNPESTDKQIVQALYGMGRSIFAPDKGGASTLSSIMKYSRVPSTSTFKLLNLASGNNPIVGAINVDIKAGKGVNVIADANKLPFQNSSFDAIVSVSPFGFDPLTSDAFRVLKEGGTFTIVGNYGNKDFKKVFNATEQELRNAGFGLMYKGKPADDLLTSFTTSGKAINPETLKQITLYKLHFD